MEITQLLCGNGTLLLKEEIPYTQFNLGLMYDNGDGVPQDDKTAMKWWRLAADQKNVGAQKNLGEMYKYGLGTKKMYTRSHMWYTLAALQGDKDAIKNRDIVEKQLAPPQITEAKKLARECVRKKYKGC